MHSGANPWPTSSRKFTPVGSPWSEIRRCKVRQLLWSKKQEMPDKNPEHPWFQIHYVVDRLWRRVPIAKITKFADLCIGLSLSVILTVLGMFTFLNEKADAVNAELQVAGVNTSSYGIYESAMQFVSKLVLGIQDHYSRNQLFYFVLAAAVPAVAGTAKYVLRKTSSNREVRKGQLQLLLDYFQPRLAPETLKVGKIYRLTLYRVRRLPRSWFGIWLGACSRSPSGTHRRMHTIFSACSESPGKCTGFVGECWWTANGATRDCLPAYKEVTDHAMRSNEKYAKFCKLTTRESSKIAHKSSRFLLEAVWHDSQVWGILVFDTDDNAWLEGSDIDFKKEVISHAAYTISIVIRSE